MAYSELIKSFEKVRDYMRQFYVYGFKSREEYDAKSARSYDNERRRLESWLGDFMSFRRDENGKSVFLSVDSRSIPHNPLYQAFKAKSFTPGDITFHFYVLDLLSDGKDYTVSQIVEGIDGYLAQFENAAGLDESSIRKKLKEYVQLGILTCGKRGRELLYRLSDDAPDLAGWRDAIAFFSEENTLGVIGSSLLDRFDEPPAYFGFKHHYMLHALDSEIAYDLFSAMSEKRCAELTIFSQRKQAERSHTVYPMKLFISVQSGRQYLLCYHYVFKKPTFFRLDMIRRVKVGNIEKQTAKYDGYGKKFSENLWGVSGSGDFTLDHVEMTVCVEDGEYYIPERLEREKRCGRIEVIDAHTYRFVADVYDVYELLPWIRTFTGRILSLESSNPHFADAFREDLDAMSALYGGGGNALS